MKIFGRLLLAVMVVWMCAGPMLGAAEAQTPTTAKIVSFGFEPDEQDVDAGTVIEWTNTSDRPHTVTDRGGTFDTGPIAPNATGKVTFSTPGEYYFFCRINPGTMNGKISVAKGNTEPRSIRIQALDPGRPGEELGFDPNEVEVAAGTPVVLANVGGKPHSLTADDGSFTTGIVPPGAGEGRFAGASASVVPNEPGEVPFHCDVHPDAMKGVLTVTGEAREGPAQGSAAPADAEVEIIDFAFDPAQASVAPGGSVTWANTGDAQHTATFDEVPGLDNADELDTGNLAPGASGKLTAPSRPGSYAYHCNVHPAKMTGVLVVAAPNAPDPTQANAGDAKQADTGKSTGIGTLALATGVGGAFLGGFGVASFLRRKPAGS